MSRSRSPFWNRPLRSPSATAVREELKKTFRPEFLNRIDDTVIFRQLGEEDLEEIAFFTARRPRRTLILRHFHSNPFPFQ